MPVDHIDQMSSHIFAGRNATDLERDVGQKAFELSAILALAIDIRRTCPIGRWRRLPGGGTFELAAHGVKPRPELWVNRAEPPPRPRNQRFQGGDLAVVQAEFV